MSVVTPVAPASASLKSPPVATTDEGAPMTRVQSLVLVSIVNSLRRGT